MFAEIDLLVAVSTCPGGDLACPLWGPGAGGEPNCNPIGVEVFRVPERLLEGWVPPEPGGYRGRHGLRPPAEHPPFNEAR